MIIVTGSVCLAWVLTEWAELLIERFNKPNLMQFVCLRCWSFWLSLGVGIIEFGWYAPLYSGISGLLGYLLDDYLLKKNSK